MGNVGRRLIKKLFLTALGLSVLLLIVNIREYFNQINTPISRNTSETNFIYNHTENLLHDIQLNIYEKNTNLNMNNNLVHNKYKYSNIITIDMDRFKKKLDYKNTMEFSAEVPAKKDWHDYEAIKTALSRTGLGELGKRAYVEKDQFGKVEAAIKESVFNFGNNGYLSGHISVNRSVPDHRAEVCKSATYLANLPKVSIIIPFKDECFPTLIRTLHSITNRTPPELLREIILVDDNSVLENLKEELDKYVDEFFPKVKLVRLKETNGLMRTRLIGAKLARSEIFVIFDAHIEVGYNWLPPLIEPIVLNKKTCTSPYIDRIQAETMWYMPMTGFRGGFDWEFGFHRLALLSKNDEIIPHPNPVMLGGLFAIRADFFWELGGYDNELQFWGGEQYELSFKIWMCGGTLLDIPCSRVGHVGQVSMPIRYKEMNSSAIFRNYMRIAEVWMDDYKKYIYQNIPIYFKNVDIGDTSTQKAVRKNLQCKSFDWYLREIAFDSLKQYPYEDPAASAGGAIGSIGFPEFCIAMELDLILNLKHCIGDADMNEKKKQSWLFTETGEIRKRGELKCLEAKTRKRKVYVSDCTGLGGRQKWIYNKKTKMIIHEVTYRCLVMAPLKKTLFLWECDRKRNLSQWEFSWYNETMNESE